MKPPSALTIAKYHGLGNDYLVARYEDLATRGAIPELVRRLCDRHRGPGGDGVLLDLGPVGAHSVGLRIINPDGSEAEKSGNGLRIFARYLWDAGRVGKAAFTIDTPGGQVSAAVHADGGEVEVAMGQASFDAAAIPVRVAPGEVLRRSLELEGEAIEFSAATVGNPHCVVFTEANASQAQRLGPKLESHPVFPNRTNVQLVQVLSRDAIRIEIWERGAGYTLASGSSSCAAAAVAHRLGLVDAKVCVHMPGGTLSIVIGADFQMHMRGPVAHVFDAVVAEDVLSPDASS